MSKISRRAALGSVAASALAPLAAKTAMASPATSTTAPAGDAKVRSMTLDEFRTLDLPVGVEDLFSEREGKTFMMCHLEMRDKHGIWIPELVPVFEKLDAVRAAGK